MEGLESQKRHYNRKRLSVFLYVTKTPLPFRIAPIDHWAYQTSSLSTIKPINHQAYWPLSLSTSGLLSWLLSLLACLFGIVSCGVATFSYPNFFYHLIVFLTVMSKFPLCDTNIKHCGGSPHYGATPATHLNKPHHQKSLVLQPKGAKTNDQAWKNILGSYCLMSTMIYFFPKFIRNLSSL